MKNKVCPWISLSSCIPLICLSLVGIFSSTPARSEQVCQVTDPTGTPLNVRDVPNGRIINAVKNGRNVYILKVITDNQGRPWAKVGGYYQGQYRVWGWVFREFISCYNARLVVPPTATLHSPSSEGRFTGLPNAKFKGET
jgi:hypothetical protein